jgi:putative salt-induced outer membrane protein YdiY
MTKPLAPAAILLCLLGRLAWADVVVISNGDRLTGTVVEVYDGKLTLDTDYAGTIKISWGKVEAVETEHLVRLRFHDDRVVEGRLVAGAKGELRFQEEGKPAPEAFQKGQLERLNEPGTVWHGHLTLSSKMEGGNTRSTALQLTGEMLRETENTRLVVRGNYGHETKSDVETEDNYYVLGKFDLHLTTAWFAYLSDEVRRDKFEDLTYRNVISAGPGYLVYRGDRFDLRVEAGPAYITEEISDGTSDSWFGGRAAVHFRFQLPFGLEIRDDFVYWPNLEQWTNWQLHNELSLNTRIGQGWHFSVSLFTDRDNHPELGRQKEDHKFLVGIGYRF